jgi:hypothetical protein
VVNLEHMLNKPKSAEAMLSLRIILMKSKRNCDCSLGQMGTAKVSLRICITTISLNLSIISAI